MKRNRTATTATSTVLPPEIGALPDCVRAAIEARLEPLILAATIDCVRVAFRDIFRAAYDGVADRRLTAFPPRDEAEFRRDLRHTVPIAAIGFVEDTLSGEVLLSANIKPLLLEALFLLRRRIDPTTHPLPSPLRGKTEQSIVDLCALLHDELCRRALLRSAAWGAHSGLDPIHSEIAALHRERLDAFASEQWTRGIQVTKSAVALAAGTDRTGLRRYLSGKHGPDSELTKRIEQVFSGERPFPAPKSRRF